MSDLLTVVKQLGQLSRDLDESVKKLAELEEPAVDAEADYKVAFAKVYGSAPGSVEDRKQLSTIETSDLFRVHGKASAAVRLQRDHIRALHARIDVGRTIQSTARAEMQLAGGQL
ncbi:hypothetical protein ACFXJ8_26310 [Nonomuraea sp. NPDC059194]|uniref:hypothetical protein n=1 Tax=Nonomuraea sp. NPDC059194 TaxID=3346764 RepID=UPI0036C00E1A